MTNVAVDAVQPYNAGSVRFRAAGAGDRETLISLCAAYRAADAQPTAPELVRRAVEAAVTGDPLIRMFLIELIEASEAPSEHAALLVGYVAVSLGFSIEVGGRDAFIDELYVEPTVQGRGLGRRALAFAEQVCRELGAQRVCLEVERANERAKKLYEQVGFRSHERFLLSKRLS